MIESSRKRAEEMTAAEANPGSTGEAAVEKKIIGESSFHSIPLFSPFPFIPRWDRIPASSN